VRMYLTWGSRGEINVISDSHDFCGFIDCNGKEDGRYVVGGFKTMLAGASW